ncbi:MAG TPA: apolipoprotein N-acyltransferase [Candidatus Acidoferrum sp.]|jgi:apolipoprotein N-acyltransferase
MSTAFRLVIAAVSGAALSLSYTGFYWSVYSWVCVGVLLLAIFNARGWVAFGCGFAHAVFFVLTSLPWIATVLAVHGGLSRVAGCAVLLLIAAVFGILTGGFAWVVRRLAERGVVWACAGAPFVWVTFEFARAHLPEIGFPWNLLGYPAAGNLALVQMASVTGIYGLSFLVAGFNALLAWACVARRRGVQRRFAMVVGAAAGIVLVMLIGPRFVPQAAAGHYARAVQVNFPEVDSYPENWFETHGGELDEIERISLAPSSKRPDLLIWPEAPAPFSFEDARFAPLGSKLAVRFGHPFLAGVIEWRAQRQSVAGGERNTVVPYNSAVLVDTLGRNVFTYDKIHLVPFGEYEPFPLIHQVVTSLSNEVGGFRKGSKYVVGQLPDGFRFGTFICYEAIFPNEVRRFAVNGAELFINISNDGWFGRSAAAEQHLRMARVRAVENRRWLLRVTNNGYTASVDPYGRMVEPLPADVRAAADLAYDFRTDETIYTRYGDWFAWLCVVVSVILLGVTFWKGNITREEMAASFEMSPLPAGGGVGMKRGPRTGST